MRGRDRLAFRSKAGFFCVPGVAVALVLPVKTNGPGVFWAENPEVLTTAGFAASAVCFCGVLEVMQGDIRAGVFTRDLLNSLSSVASENRTLTLRVERTEGRNGPSSFPEGFLEGILLAESKVWRRFSSAGVLLTATGLNIVARAEFFWKTKNMAIKTA